MRTTTPATPLCNIIYCSCFSLYKMLMKTEIERSYPDTMYPSKHFIFICTGFKHRLNVMGTMEPLNWKSARLTLIVRCPICQGDHKWVPSVLIFDICVTNFLIPFWQNSTRQLFYMWLSRQWPLWSFWSQPHVTAGRHHWYTRGSFQCSAFFLQKSQYRMPHREPSTVCHRHNVLGNICTL